MTNQNTHKTVSQDFLDTVKEITRKFDALKVPAHYQAVYVSYPSWEDTSPIYKTKEEAEQWLSKSMAWSGRPNDWGYINEVILDRPVAAESEAV
jgi:hypothetical protein